MIKNSSKLLFAILICLGTGMIGSLFTTPFIKTWYAELLKPSFSPPNWIFAPVWTILFILMGIAVWFIWQKGIGQKMVKNAVTFFGIQLVLNILWSFLFFTFHSPLLAFIDITILLVLIVLITKDFFKISKIAGYLMVPYVLWVFFALFLNLFIVFLN